MNRGIILISLCVVLSVLLLTSCGREDDHKSEQESLSQHYLYKINQILKEEAFATAKPQDSKIVLYDEENEVLKEIPYEDYDKSTPFIVARKDGGCIFFVTDDEADTEEGILFVNDRSDGFMDGIATIERVGNFSNTYMYCTMQ